MYFCVFCLLILLYVWCVILISFFFFFKQKTAYEMRISDWSSDVCSSDLLLPAGHGVIVLLLADRIGAEQSLVTLGQILCGLQVGFGQIGRASCRERVCQYV